MNFLDEFPRKFRGAERKRTIHLPRLINICTWLLLFFSGGDRRLSWNRLWPDRRILRNPRGTSKVRADIHDSRINPTWSRRIYDARTGLHANIPRTEGAECPFLKWNLIYADVSKLIKRCDTGNLWEAFWFYKLGRSLNIFWINLLNIWVATKRNIWY